MNPQGRILIIDNAAPRRRALHGDLLAAGFEVADAEHLGEAIAICRVTEFDIVVLNLQPQENRIESFQSLRAEAPRTAMVVLMEFDDPNRMAEMLEAGADQCLVRPVHLPEFIARLRATLRRSRHSSNPCGSAIAIGDITLDTAQRQVYRAGVPVHLSGCGDALVD